tara:strand:+ start:2550 stop:3398 length:849 start_codon:yes stop_codon:yes gene_type:complete
MKVEKINLTPVMAEKFLTKNKGNRSVRINKVTKYSYQMSNDQWVPNGDPIRFDLEDNLIDGQHRLKAAIKSNTTLVDTIVVRGLSAQAYTTIDDGVVRKIGDVLKRENIPNAAEVGALARWMIVIERGFDPRITHQHGQVTKTDIRNWVLNNNERAQEVVKLAKKASAGCPIGKSPWSVFLYQAITDRGTDTAEEFIDGCVNGHPNPYDPRNTIRKWIVKLKASSGHQKRITTIAQLAALTNAYNYWVTGLELKAIYIIRKKAAFPEFGVLSPQQVRDSSDA